MNNEQLTMAAVRRRGIFTPVSILQRLLHVCVQKRGLGSL